MLGTEHIPFCVTLVDDMRPTHLIKWTTVTNFYNGLHEVNYMEINSILCWTYVCVRWDLPGGENFSCLPLVLTACIFVVINVSGKHIVYLQGTFTMKTAKSIYFCTHFHLQAISTLVDGWTDTWLRTVGQKTGRTDGDLWCRRKKLLRTSGRCGTGD
jgi:hypothetical protein